MAKVESNLESEKKSETHFASQDTPIELQVGAHIDEPHIRWDLLSHANSDQISRNQILGWQFRLFSIPKDKNVRGKHPLNGRHYTRCRKVLPSIEYGLEKKDNQQNDSKCQVGGIRLGLA